MTDAPAIDIAALRAAAEAAAKDWYVAHDTFQVYANPKAILALLDSLAAAEAAREEAVGLMAADPGKWGPGVQRICRERNEARAERESLAVRLAAAQERIKALEAALRPLVCGCAEPCAEDLFGCAAARALGKEGG